MAKYTILLAEYLKDGGELPAVFSQIDDFNELFIARFCDREIGFETEDLFYLKLELRANLVIPEYAKRLTALNTAWVDVNDPQKTSTRTYDSAEKRTQTTDVPINAITATPTQTSKQEEFEDVDETVNKGVTQDEAIRRIEFLQNQKFILLENCLNEFNNLFMVVY